MHGKYATTHVIASTNFLAKEHEFIRRRNAAAVILRRGITYLEFRESRTGRLSLSYLWGLS
jgi:hypothetical protein